MKALLLFLACLCSCSQRARDPNAWSRDPAHRGKNLFEGARLGWHSTAAEDDAH